MELKQKLANLRRSKGLTQLELAEMLSVSRQAVSRWEVGTAVPSLDNLVSLSEVYGMPLDDLIQGEAPVPGAAGEADMPSPPPSKTGRFRTPPVLVLLAVLILGVGILIGIGLSGETKVSETGPNQRVVIDDPQGRLERTPTDIEDELEWLETTAKDLLEDKKHRLE